MTKQTNKIKPKPKPKSETKKTASGKKHNRILRSTHDALDGSFLRNGNIGAKVRLILFIAALGLIYIANNHFAEKKIREIDRLRKLNKELSFDYLRMKTQLNEKKRASYLADRLKPYGIKPAVEPPQKLIVNPKK
jgi:hypothetical protein